MLPTLAFFACASAATGLNHKLRSPLYTPAIRSRCSGRTRSGRGGTCGADARRANGSRTFCLETSIGPGSLLGKRDVADGQCQRFHRRNVHSR
jgi:hypothetical protein